MSVEYSTDGTSFTDISDEAQVIGPAPMTRTLGSGTVFGEDIPVVTAGKREPVDVPLRLFFQDSTTATLAMNAAYTAFTTACGGLFVLRWSPTGGTAGEVEYTTNTTYSEVMTYPAAGGDSGSADPLMLEIVVRTADVTMGVGT
jgi:hypothetical protein